MLKEYHNNNKINVCQPHNTLCRWTERNNSKSRTRIRKIMYYLKYDKIELAPFFFSGAEN